jgi:hypothetical protein
MPWLYCPACGKEREVTGKGNMYPHNRWDVKLGKMVRCDGSGKPALTSPPRK